MTPQIGLQLYTVRDELARDFSGTLARVAAIGYRGVETAFFDERVPLDEVARELGAHSLAPFVAHIPLPPGAGRDVARRTPAGRAGGAARGGRGCRQPACLGGWMVGKANYPPG